MNKDKISEKIDTFVEEAKSEWMFNLKKDGCIKEGDTIGHEYVVLNDGVAELDGFIQVQKQLESYRKKENLQKHKVIVWFQNRYEKQQIKSYQKLYIGLITK